MALTTRIHAASGPLEQAITRAGVDTVAIPVRSGGPTAEIGDLSSALPVSAAEILASQRAKGEPGEIVPVPVKLAGKVVELLLAGVGDASAPALRKAGAAIARRCRGRSALVVVPPEGTGPAKLAAFAEGALLASYTFSLATADNPKSPVPEIAVVTGDHATLDQTSAITGAVALARDLANAPSAGKTPAWLAEQAQEVAGAAGITVRVRDEEALRAEGFGGILAVGSGSSRPPRLIELSYDPGSASRHIVLAGKGITFDSGGLSLKPSDGMKLMKTDMAGGAVVLATMSVLRDLGVNVKVTGLIAAAENMPSGSAMRPGDVIKHYGGTTSEVLNTDAEGRLVLADALAYADTVLRPDLLVDVATLTGAARIALGNRTGALYATDDALADGLREAGLEVGEQLWRMPLTEDYREDLDSDVADLANIGRNRQGAGSITAALYLREFAGQRAWAHLDMSGPSRATADDGEVTKGATGFGIRLLLRWLLAAGS